MESMLEALEKQHGSAKIDELRQKTLHDICDLMRDTQGRTPSH